MPREGSRGFSPAPAGAVRRRGGSHLPDQPYPGAAPRERPAGGRGRQRQAEPLAPGRLHQRAGGLPDHPQEGLRDPRPQGEPRLSTSCPWLGGGEGRRNLTTRATRAQKVHITAGSSYKRRARTHVGRCPRPGGKGEGTRGVRSCWARVCGGSPDESEGPGSRPRFLGGPVPCPIGQIK